MQIARLWRAHVCAGCPPEARELQIAGTDAPILDAEITACISAYLTQTLTVDARIERRLREVCDALQHAHPDLEPSAAAYCARLGQLVSAVLTETGAGRA
ncbi:MAG: hypothetical protein IPI06_08710 [Gammaproteobacteria bacterium]|nr:hypothetical protein [Gammaproteobacteria bacterium]